MSPRHPPRHRCASAAVLALTLLPLLAATRESPATATPAIAARVATAEDIFRSARRSVVAVAFTLETELSKTERVCSGVVVDPDGLVMFPMAAVDERFPDDQLKQFSVTLPADAGDGQANPVPATFLGRDPRTKVAFCRAQPGRSWTPLAFAEGVSLPVGSDVYSVGLTPTSAGCHPYLVRGMVSGTLGGEVPRLIVGGGGVAATGSPLFDATGRAVGFVNYQPPFPLLLNDKDSMLAVINPPRFATLAADFAQSLRQVPSPGKPVAAAWSGIPDLALVRPADLRAIGIDAPAALRIGSVVRGGPAALAGLALGDLIVGVDGKPLDDRGDPQELAAAFHHRLLCMPPGSVVSLSVVRAAEGHKRDDVSLKLADQPLPPMMAKRSWRPDLGFGVRESVSYDAFALDLKDDTRGVVVVVVKPGSAASACRVRPGDLLVRIDGAPVRDLAAFDAAVTSAAQRKTQSMTLEVLRSNRVETLKLDVPQ